MGRKPLNKATAGAGTQVSTSAPVTAAVTSPSWMLRTMRTARTFDIFDYVRRKPYFCYGLFIVPWTIGWNYRQYTRMEILYPDYDDLVNSETGKGFASAKEQELVDLEKYNQNVLT